MRPFFEPVPASPRQTVALAAALQGIGGGLGWSIVPPLMPQLAQELSLSHGWSGLVWGAAPLGIALAAPVGGAAVDRFGARWTAGLAMLVGALACAARALCGDGLSLAIAMFAFGLHVGFVAPALPRALASHLPLNKVARANGLALLAYTLGTAATMLAARTVLVPLFGGWRPAMVGAAAAMALTGALWLWLFRDRLALSKHASLGEVFSLVHNAGLRRVALMHFCLFGGYLALLGMLARALIERGMAPAQAGLSVAGWLVAAGAANFLGPILADRVGKRAVLVGGGLVAGTALMGLALLPGVPVLPLLIVAALGGGCVAPLLLTLPLELPGVGPQRAGAALGLLMLVGQAGGFLLPVLSGQAMQWGGFAAAVGFLAAVHLLIAAPAAGLEAGGRVDATGVPAAT